MARNPVAPRRHWRAGPPKTSPAKPLKMLLVAFVGIAVVGVVAASQTRTDTPPSSALPLVLPTVAEPSSATKTPVEAAPAGEAVPFMEASAAGSVAYRSGDYASALAHFRDAVARNPNDAEAQSNLGQVLVRMQQTAESIEHFDRAIALNPDRWAYHFNRARALGLLQRWDEAADGYRRAQQIYPDDYAIAFNFGQALQRKGDHGGAVEQYKRAATLDPNEPSFQMALGMSYERLQKPAEAAAAYAEALRLAPQAPDAERVRQRIQQLTRSGS